MSLCEEEELEEEEELSEDEYYKHMLAKYRAVEERERVSSSNLTPPFRDTDAHPNNTILSTSTCDGEGNGQPESDHSADSGNDEHVYSVDDIALPNHADHEFHTLRAHFEAQLAEQAAQFNQSLADRDQQLNILDNHQYALETDLAAKEEEVENLKHKLGLAQRQILDYKRENHALQTKIRQCVPEQQRDALEKKIEKLKTEDNRNQEELRQLLHELDSCEKEAETMRSRVKELETKLKRQEDQINGLQHACTKDKREKNDLKDQIIKWEDKVTQYQADVQHLELDVKQEKDKVKAEGLQLRQYCQEVEVLKRENKELKKTVENAQCECEKRQGTSNQLQGKLDDLLGKLHEITGEVDRLRHQNTALTHSSTKTCAENDELRSINTALKDELRRLKSFNDRTDSPRHAGSPSRHHPTTTTTPYGTLADLHIQDWDDQHSDGSSRSWHKHPRHPPFEQQEDSTRGSHHLPPSPPIPHNITKDASLSLSILPHTDNHHSPVGHQPTPNTHLTSDDVAVLKQLLHNYKNQNHDVHQHPKLLSHRDYTPTRSRGGGEGAPPCHHPATPTSSVAGSSQFNEHRHTRSSSQPTSTVQGTTRSNWHTSASPILGGPISSPDTNALEKQLLNLNMKKQQVEGELTKIRSNDPKSRTIRGRQHKKDLEEELDNVSKSIGTLKGQLRSLQVLTK